MNVSRKWAKKALGSLAIALIKFFRNKKRPYIYYTSNNEIDFIAKLMEYSLK